MEQVPYLLAYFVLLQMGFTSRKHCCFLACALTARFHPYLVCKTLGGIFSVALAVNFRPPHLYVFNKKTSYEASFLLGVQTFLPLFDLTKNERLLRIPKRGIYPTNSVVKILLIVMKKVIFFPSNSLPIRILSQKSAPKRKAPNNKSLRISIFFAFFSRKIIGTR